MMIFNSMKICQVLSMLSLYLLMHTSSAKETEVVYREGKPQVRVVPLTSDNFETALQDPANPFWLLKFYAPWCGHCKKMAPTLEIVAAQTIGKMAIGKIDCTVETKLCRAHSVFGYPTIKYSLDAEIDEYPGGRDQSDLLNFAEKMTRPVINFVSDLNDETVANFLSKTDEGVGFMAYHPDVSAESRPSQTELQQMCSDNKFLQIYSQVARKKRANSYFGLLPSNVDVSSLGSSSEEPFIVRLESNVKPRLFHYSPPQDRNKDDGEEDSDVDENIRTSMYDFITINNVPLVSTLGVHNFHKLSRSGRPLVIGVVDETNTDQVNIVKSALIQYASNVKDDATVQDHIDKKYFFSMIDGKRWDRFLERFEVNTKHLPIIFVLDAPSKKFWNQPEYYHGMDDDGNIVIKPADQITTDHMYTSLFKLLVDIDNGKIESKLPSDSQGIYYFLSLLSDPKIAIPFGVVIFILIIFIVWICTPDPEDLRPPYDNIDDDHDEIYDDEEEEDSKDNVNNIDESNEDSAGLHKRHVASSPAEEAKEDAKDLSDEGKKDK